MRISLNGDWQFKDYLGEDWRWRDAHMPGTRDVNHWRTGCVPGTVQNDLWKAGALANPYLGMNSLLAEWVPARTWLYKKTFAVSGDLRGKRLQLRFEGVDYEAEFFLNGQSLGRHVGMYTPAIFEVTDKLSYGADNLIAVVIEPAPHEQPQVGRTSKVRTHKSRMTYWWDFCPRLVHLGIWDDVFLEVTDNVRIADVFVRPQPGLDSPAWDVSISMTLDAARHDYVQASLTLRYGDFFVSCASMPHALAPGETHLNYSLNVEHPRLWWPNGSGEQPLYDLEVSIRPIREGKVDGDHEMDRRVVPFGIRRLELVANEDAAPDALAYTLVVNGRKTYIKGWNWVPLDVMYGVPRPEKLEHLFQLAQRAHVNLLRVWGGGLIEREAFYELADRYGILVWQEFIQSSSGIDNDPPESPEFVTMMTREAEGIIPRRRNHPSLAFWCGGNELQDKSGVPLDDTHPVLAALRAAVARLDPDRLWLATSPTGHVFMNSLENIARDPCSLHDVHGPWEYQGVAGQQTLYNAGTSLLHSEFGVEGMTNLKTLNATIALEDQQPVSLNNPYWQHLSAWWVKERVWRETFGDVTDVPALVRATQTMQADGLRYALESDRRRKFHNSGTLPWQFNEPYPMAACTSAVDYYGQAKPAYYAVARAYEPVHVSAKFETVAWAGRATFAAEVWVANSLEASEATLRTRLVGFGGKVYTESEQAVPFPANSAARLVAVDFPLEQLEDIFFLDLVLTNTDGAALSRNRYVFTRATNLAPLLAVPQTLLAVHKAELGDDWGLTVTNIGDVTALFVWLEDGRELGEPGCAYFDDNHFCLLPGEARQIAVTWQGVSDAWLDVRGWNTP